MTPKNSKPKPPPAPVESWSWEAWEAGANDRENDVYFDWDFYCAAEDRSLDRLHEMHRREEAATRAVMKIKDKIRDAGIWIPPSSREHFLAAADFRAWAKTETDPKKAELISLGNLAEGAPAFRAFTACGCPGECRHISHQ
jgi:hypothetical protein